MGYSGIFAELGTGLAVVLTALVGVVGWRWRGAKLREEARGLKLANDQLERQLSATTGEVLRELRPNGGGSLADKLDRRFTAMEVGQEAMGVAVGRVADEIADLRGTVRGIQRDVGRNATSMMDMRREAAARQDITDHRLIVIEDAVRSVSAESAAHTDEGEG